MGPVYIDTDDYAASGITFLRTDPPEVFFSGGEPHANVPVWPSKIVHVHAKIRRWVDMAKLLVVCDALYTQGVEVHLFMPYLPGARQDRNPLGNTPLTSRIYARILAGITTTITCVDPHSQLAVDNYLEFLDDIRTVDTALFLKGLVRDAPDVILCPDEGGKPRAEAAAELFNCKIVYASKNRTFGNGQLSGFELPDMRKHIGLGPIRFLIVDDICDGGGTFLGLLGELRKQRPSMYSSPCDLYVTHGIFSRGVDVLCGFNRLYTTDSFYRADTRSADANKVTYTNLLPHYFGGLRP